MAAETLDGRAQAPAAIEPPHHRPDWLKKPSGDDMAWAYPPAAARKGIGGKAVITCHVATDGGLTNCRVVSETPQDEGFGIAAVALSGQFRMTPSNDPEHLSQVTIPVVFALPAPTTLSEPPPGPLRTVVIRDQALWKFWAESYLKTAPVAEIAWAGLAVAVLVAVILIGARLRRHDAKDLSGPNSERRR
jgi:TonB family protein